jgi:ATP/maltotriose-dependent transcriptional regulator MalT
LARALQLTQQLLMDGLDSVTWLEWPTLHPQQLLAEILAALGQGEAAEAALCALRDEAVSQNFVARIWSVQITLGKLYLDEKKMAQAEDAFAAAHNVVELAAATILDEEQRRGFLERAMAMIPAMPSPAPRQSDLHKFGGLTERERMVTKLVAQGLSNPEIADALVLSKRTVETHISNIMSKLGFDRRAQIIAWAVEKGLNEAE